MEKIQHYQNAALPNDFHTLKKLFKKGVDVNTPLQNGSYALNEFCRIGDMDTIKFLLENGAMTNVYDENGNTPLYEVFAIDDPYKQIECAHYLIKNGAIITKYIRDYINENPAYTKINKNFVNFLNKQYEMQNTYMPHRKRIAMAWSKLESLLYEHTVVCLKEFVEYDLGDYKTDDQNFTAFAYTYNAIEEQIFFSLNTKNQFETQNTFSEYEQCNIKKYTYSNIGSIGTLSLKWEVIFREIFDIDEQRTEKGINQVIHMGYKIAKRLYEDNMFKNILPVVAQDFFITAVLHDEPAEASLLRIKKFKLE